jgi:hypothetical protein
MIQIVDGDKEDVRPLALSFRRTDNGEDHLRDQGQNDCGENRSTLYHVSFLHFIVGRQR